MGWRPGRRQLPLIVQAEKNECALACLAMVLGWHGHSVDINTLRQRYAISPHGATLKSTMAMADRLDLACRPLRLEPKDLVRLQCPAMLHWDMNHFVVLSRVKKKGVVIHDPASGRRELGWAELSRHFTGVALELMPTPAFQPRKELKKLHLRDLWSRSRGLGGSLGQIFVLSLMLQLFSLGLPFYTQLFIDDVLVNQDFALLKVLALGFFMITVVKCVTELIRSYAVLYLGNSLGFQFAVNVFRHLLHLPLDYFSRRHMGDIVSRFGSLNQLKEFLCSGIVEVVIDGLMVTGTLVLMFVYSSTLTWVALVAVVIYALLRLALYRSFQRRNEEVITAGAMENTQFMENIRAIQGIRLFGREADRLAGWQNFYADVINSGFRLQKLGISIRFAHGLLVGTENIVLMLLGGYAVLNNQISMGMIIAYISFKDQLYARVFALLDKLFEFRLLEVHLARLADIVLTQKEKHRTGIGVPPPEVCLAGGLEARQLAFRYAADSPFLFQQVNLQMAQDESVAIIGPTGCGKSTLLRLLLGLLEPEDGQISMYGMPVHTMGLSAYRERIAGVLQDDSLLSGSILENITFFDPAPDLERVEYVAHLAALAGDIRTLPMQYNTLVGSMGSALSGGQVQRILLARALYRQPRLLVLDEATSHLDVDTEKLVSQAIRNMNIARIVVAHRPQTIVQADTIYRLQPGGLQSVTHAELQTRSHAGAVAL